MARLKLTKALTLRDGAHFFRKGVDSGEIPEGDYHRLILTGRLMDPDRSFESIPPANLKRLSPGTVVTVVRSMGLGDVLMVLPVIRALKRDFPALLFRYCVGTAYAPLLAGIDFLCDTTPIIEMSGRVDHVIELRGLSERHEKRRIMDRIEIFALYCGVKVSDFSIPVSVSEAERTAARALIGRPAPTIALTVRGSSGHRSWIPEHVRDFAVLAADAGWRVVILDGDRDLKIAGTPFPEHDRIVNLSGQLNLSQVKGILAVSDFCVAPDTGLVHLSEAVGTKCLALFSTVPPALRTYHYKHVKAMFRRDLPCAPCWERGCGPMPCMREITPRIVLDALESWDRLPRDSNPKPFAIVAAA